MRLARIPEKVLPTKRVFVPADFGRIIQQIPEDCPLVGGQAVAWWQQQYCPSDNPITSCDIDFWGYREDLERVAKALGQKPVYPHKYEMTVWVGGIPLLLKGEKTLVEFIHTVPGIDVITPEKASVLQTFSMDETRKPLLVLSPVSLVLAKLHALRAFVQEQRQDLLHLQTSLLTAHHFIVQLLRDTQIKQVLWNIERLVTVSQIKPYRRLEKEHGFKILSAVPLREIGEVVRNEFLPGDDLNRLHKFLTVRWPQVESGTATEGGIQQ